MLCLYNTLSVVCIDGVFTLPLTDLFVAVEPDSLDCPAPVDNDSDMIIMHVQYVCIIVHILHNN